MRSTFYFIVISLGFICLALAISGGRRGDTSIQQLQSDIEEIGVMPYSGGDNEPTKD